MVTQRNQGKLENPIAIYELGISTQAVPSKTRKSVLFYRTDRHRLELSLSQLDLSGGNFLIFLFYQVLQRPAQNDETDWPTALPGRTFLLQNENVRNNITICEPSSGAGGNHMFEIVVMAERLEERISPCRPQPSIRDYDSKASSFDKNRMQRKRQVGSHIRTARNPLPVLIETCGDIPDGLAILASASLCDERQVAHYRVESTKLFFKPLTIRWISKLYSGFMGQGKRRLEYLVSSLRQPIKSIAQDRSL